MEMEATKKMAEPTAVTAVGGVDEQDYTAIAIKYIDTMGMDNQLTKEQKEQFIQIAAAYRLNPFKREIYAVPYRMNNGDTQVSIIVEYEVYLKIVERTGLLDGWSVNIVFENGEIYAVCTIHRKDWTHPFIWKVPETEFNKGFGSWKSMPEFMLKKVAIAQAFRLAFPYELGGLPNTREEADIINASNASNDNGNVVDATDINKDQLQVPTPVQSPTEMPTQVTADVQQWNIHSIVEHLLL